MIGLMALATAAAVPTPLAPTGKWVVDYQKDMCLVSRSFGPANANTMFALKPAIAMEEGGQTLFVLSTNTGGSGMRHGQALVTLLPSGIQKKLEYASIVPDGAKFRGFEFDADADFVAALGEASGITIVAGKEVFSFATGKIQPVLKALTACNENLFRSWGVDPGAKALTLRGMSPARWFPADSYPVAAKQRGAQGRSVIVLTVSADGRPSACRVVVKADPDLDDQTCRSAMRNGRYETSPGKSDRYSILAVRWELGG
jgi:hypothetical protein